MLRTAWRCYRPASASVRLRRSRCRRVADSIESTTYGPICPHVRGPGKHAQGERAHPLSRNVCCQQQQARLIARVTRARQRCVRDRLTVWRALFGPSATSAISNMATHHALALAPAANLAASTLEEVAITTHTLRDLDVHACRCCAMTSVHKRVDSTSPAVAAHHAARADPKTVAWLHQDADLVATARGAAHSRPRGAWIAIVKSTRGRERVDVCESLAWPCWLLLACYCLASGL